MKRNILAIAAAAFALAAYAESQEIDTAVQSTGPQDSDSIATWVTCDPIINSTNIPDTPTHPRHVKVDLATRIDYDQTIREVSPDPGGFYGRYLYMHVDADINDKFDVHMRQCLNKFGDMSKDVFGATDWVYVNYNPDERFTLNFGKQPVAIGGYEYDAYPIDVYYSSLFWQSIACFQFGAAATWHFDIKDRPQHLMLQVTNSPYCQPFTNRYSYNLMYTGKIGPWSPMWSVNMIEYAMHLYGRFISLGNRFDFGRFYTEIDLMSRDWKKKVRLRNLNDDFTIIGKVNYSIGQFDIFAKGGYEKMAETPGFKKMIDNTFYGGGVEYFPLKHNRNLRLHAAAYMWHKYPTGEKLIDINVGVKWRVTLFDK